MDKLLTLLLALLVSACTTSPATDGTLSSADRARLAQTLAAQPADVQARYAYRHPQETLEFFGIRPGMTVVEALPGGGWYSKILLDYLGSDGQLIGVDYPADMWPKFGIFDDNFIAAKAHWVNEWPAEARGWGDGDDAAVAAFVFGAMPAAMRGSADAVLFIRAIHNLSRFEADGGYLTQALSDAYQVLKPGGVVGIVQHAAPPTASDEWARGGRGYMKADMVIGAMRKAGFEYIGASDINANPLDQPGEDDVVWRLPPTLFTSRDDAQMRAALQAIGESNRMTLKFRKPL